MHSKAILIDKKYLFLGSINFSNYSLDSNREVGILLINKKNIEKFLEIFNKDFY
jgi:phosphatidylserine/phosphatidylglycerophosphate/cardiolipin synthase-like enzyme